MNRNVIIMGITALVLMSACASSSNEEVEIISEFPGEKVVYTTDSSLDQSVYENDCQERGGEFNSCGNICEPNADFCAEVCAYTCELN